MITLSEKDKQIAKEVIPNLNELLQDEKNARELVFQLNDAMIETMDENDTPSDKGREYERIMDDINYRYLAKKKWGRGSLFFSHFRHILDTI